MRQGYRVWTSEDLRKLRTLFEDGLVVADIADRLGRTLASVYRKCDEIGLWTSEKRPWTGRDLSTLREMRTRGATYGEIGRTIGRATCAVQAMSGRLAVTSRTESPVWTPWADATLARMRAEGKSGAEIGKALGTTKGAVSGRAHAIGLPTLKRGRKPG